MSSPGLRSIAVCSFCVFMMKFIRHTSRTQLTMTNKQTDRQTDRQMSLLHKGRQYESVSVSFSEIMKQMMQANGPQIDHE